MNWSYYAIRTLSGQLRGVYRRKAPNWTVEKFDEHKRKWVDGSRLLVLLAGGDAGEGDLISEEEANSLTGGMARKRRGWWKF